MLVSQDRVLLFSVSWAKAEMARMGIRVRKATTDRTVSAKQIRDDGALFYKELSQTDVGCKALLFNMDEFFVHLDNSNQQWTWERVKRGEKKNIAVASNKMGFTCSVLSSADGQIHLMQLIWQGKTTAVHAVPEGQPHAKIMQQHSERSHFQCQATFAEWLSEFKIVVARIRVEHSLPTTHKAVLILDAATQHVTEEVGLACENISIVQIPKKQTHCFQPADMFIISCIKQKAKKAWGAHIEELFTTSDAGDATKQLLDGRLKVRRDRKYRYLAEAIDTTSAEVVVKSWTAAGILRAVFNEPPPESTTILYDQYCELANLEEDAEVLTNHNSLCLPSPKSMQQRPFPPNLRVRENVPDHLGATKQVVLYW
ncbi:hypothetical protein DIPPA_00754 [Diplonema papillatum]|nr:hypothetical protein DIPPA_00754 [Diplonema papillatum]